MGRACTRRRSSTLLYSNFDPVAHKERIEAATQYLIANQMGNGAWDYNSRQAGDASITQYAILGLWEVVNAGVTVPPRVWYRAAQWYLSTQHGTGWWKYHVDEAKWEPTVAIAAGGVGSLLICRRQLEPYRQGGSANPLLVPLLPVNPYGGYKVETPEAAIDAAIRRGMAWIAARFSPSKNPVMGRSVYYGLYGIERIGALADEELLGGIDWFARGVQLIAASQEASGGWSHQYGHVPNTAWAILFLTRSTEKTLKRIEVKRLGAGTLIGGRGAAAGPVEPDGSRRARVLPRPMNGVIEGMLAVLEDPRAGNADSAVAGLIRRYRADGPAALRPFSSRTGSARC